MDLNTRFNYKPGELARLSNIRSYPKIEMKGIEPIEWHQERMDLYFPSHNMVQENPKAWCKLAIYHISQFYYFNVSEYEKDNMTGKKLMTGLIGILMCISNATNASAIIDNTDLIESLKSAGITFTFYEISERETELLNSHHYIDLRDEFTKDDIWETVIGDPTYPLVMMCVIMLCMVKPLNANNASKWLTNRLKTFSRSARNKRVSTLWEQHMPTTDYLQDLNAFVTANFKLRRSCFLIILEVSMSPPDNIIVTLCKDVIQLMRGAELHHLVLIDHFIMTKYRELLGMSILNDLQVRFENALDRLKREKACNMLFIKLLYPKDNTSELDRQNFKNAAIVATTCARWEFPTFDNYYMDELERSKKISATVEEYLDLRLKMAKVRVGKMEAAYVGPSFKRQLYFDRVIEEYKKRDTVEIKDLGFIPRFSKNSLAQLKSSSYKKTPSTDSDEENSET